MTIDTLGGVVGQAAHFAGDYLFRETALPNNTMIQSEEHTLNNTLGKLLLVGTIDKNLLLTGTNGPLRQQYLNWASVLITSAFVFQKDVEVENNERIRIAVCEQALYLMRRIDTYPEALTKGIVSASAGPVSATFSKDFVAPLICEGAKLAIGEAGHFVKDMAVVKTMPLGGIWAE